MKWLRRASLGCGIVAVALWAFACAKGVAEGEGDSPEGDASSDRATGTHLPSGSSGAGSSSGGTSSGGACGGKVVLNEVMTEGSSADEEFVELFNSGTCAVSLDGWQLAYRSGSGSTGPVLHTFASGASIAPNAFFVLGTTKFKGGKDAVMSSGMAFDDGQIGLFDESGDMVDGLGYGNAKAAPDGGTFVEGSSADSPPKGGSLVRKVDGIDSDDNAADFARADDPSAGESNP